MGVQCPTMKKTQIFVLMLSLALFPSIILAAEHTKHVDANGYTFTYVEAGKGEPVIVVHGALADYRSEAEVAERLATRFHVIRYSRRYHYPDKPTNISDYSPDVHARDLVAIIRALNLGPVHLVGHSYGGMVALLAANSAPDLIRTVTLEEPFPLPSFASTDPTLHKERATLVADLREKVSAGKSNAAVDEMLGWVRGNDGRLGDSPVQQREMGYENEATLLPMLTPTGPPPAFTCEVAQKFSRPSLLLHGEHTRPLYLSVVTRLSKCLPNAELTQISNSTHFVNVDNPNESASAILKFLARYSGK